MGDGSPQPRRRRAGAGPRACSIATRRIQACREHSGGRQRLRPARRRVRPGLESTFYLDTTLDAPPRHRPGAPAVHRSVPQAHRPTWHERVEALRLAHARKLLAVTDQPVIGSVAFECGFDDLSHFHRVFKARTGRTPLEYRNRGS
jgi:AraC-like DNA-binding protein